MSGILTIKKIVRLTRMREWVFSKLAPLFIVFYSFILSENPNPGRAILSTIACLLLTSICFAYGYLINDVSDKKPDELAGKENASRGMNNIKAWVLLISMLVIGFAVIFSFGGHLAVYIFAVIGFILATGYSIKSVRLKERGIWGIIIASFAQRVMPVLFAMSFYDTYSYLIISLIILFVFVGIRWILIHQIIDYDNDIKSNVNTFAIERGKVIAIKIIYKIIIPLEILSILLWLTILLTTTLSAIIIIPLYLIWIVGVRLKVNKNMIIYTVADYEYPALEDFYLLIAPTSLGIIVIANQPFYSILLVIMLVLQYQAILKYYIRIFNKKQKPVYSKI